MSAILNDDGLMTLLEANKREGFENTEEFFAQVNKEHAILDVLPWFPSSDKSFHKYGQVKSTGKGAWRKINEGYAKGQGTVESVSTPVQIYGAVSTVSEDVLNASKTSGALIRSSEDLLVGKGIVEDFINSFFMEDGSNPDAMKGVEFYRHALGKYCLDAGGTTNGKLTSIYLLQVGQHNLNIRYNPDMSGSEYGIGMLIRDRGEREVEDDKGRPMYVFRTTFDLSAALELKTDASLIRIANVDPTQGWNANLFIDALELMPNNAANVVAVVPRSIHSQLTKYALDKSNNMFSTEQIENMGLVTKFLGIPMLREDAISVTQNRIGEDDASTRSRSNKKTTPPETEPESESEDTEKAA